MLDSSKKEIISCTQTEPLSQPCCVVWSSYTKRLCGKLWIFGCCVSQQLLCFGSLYAKSPKNMVLCTVPHHGWIWMAPLLLHWSTIPQSHCSSMLSTCRSIGNFRIFDWSNPKRISDWRGFPRDFCKPAAAALQATVLLQEVHDSNTCDMQMSIRLWTDASRQCSAMSSLQAWGNAGCKPQNQSCRKSLLDSSRDTRTPNGK